MCIYCGTNKYRKIYENHYGKIPKESNGKTYEIHHKDGNHSNNDPKNLIAVTAKDHYDIHYSQGDYFACFRLAQRVDVTQDQLRKFAQAGGLAAGPSQKKRVENRTHNLLRRIDGSSLVGDRVKNGSHHWLKDDHAKGENNSRYDNTLYCFENSKTKERVIMTQYHFTRTYNLNPGNVNWLIKGKNKSVKGWVLS